MLQRYESATLSTQAQSRLLEYFRGREQLFSRVVQLFAQDYPVKLQRMRAALCRHDGPAAAEDAHQLAGELRTFMAEPPLLLVKEIQAAGLQNACESALPLCDRLETMLSDLAQTLACMIRSGGKR